MGGQTNNGNARAKDAESGERTLIYFPIIHTQTDMGALSESIQHMKVKRLGRKEWERNLSFVNKLWSDIEQAVESLALPYERVRVYQDGLPVCGREMQIVEELAKAGSRNHRLLLRLKQKGATIMGTESSDSSLRSISSPRRLSPQGRPRSPRGGKRAEKP